MKILSRLIYILLFANLEQISFCQQLPLYSQYLYNKFLINPAHAGSDGFTSFNITAREQWTGFSHNPETYSLSWQSRILKKGYRINKTIFNRSAYVPKSDGKVGLGCYVFSDRNGLLRRTGFQASYSYNLWLKQNTQLSMGIAFTGYHFRINANEDSFEDQNEPWINNNLRRGVFVPDADFGFYLLNPKYDFGFSAMQLFGAAVKTGNNAYSNFRTDRHYYLFGSYNITAGTRAELEPTMLLKISEQIKPQADIGITYIYNQNLWTGIAYRTGGGLITNIRFRYIHGYSKWTTFFFGYALDFTLNQIQRVTYGTHELTIALKFGDSSRRYRWLDRY